MIIVCSHPDYTKLKMRYPGRLIQPDSDVEPNVFYVFRSNQRPPYKVDLSDGSIWITRGLNIFMRWR